MATAGVPPEDTAGASSLFNVMRNLGGSIGIALLQTFTTRQEHFHFDVVSERVTQNDLLVQERLQLMAQRMLPHADGPADAAVKALGRLQALVRQEAYVMAYSDCFFIMGAVLLLALPAVLIMQKPRHRAAAR
jgi:DHA2 family multidrug resistance protein